MAPVVRLAPAAFRLCLAICSGSLLWAADTEPVRFNRDIRPIMADTCFRCHGPDKSSRMANMRLDIREEALKPNRRGQIPIVPGDPDKSLIIQRIFADSQARIMPPASAHRTLSEKQKDTIKRWVAEGAKYEGHWAYQPVQRPAIPSLPAGKQGNPIDALVLARLERDGLTLSPEADRRTLIRRVTLDLTGLPPSPAEVEAFVKDKTPDAYAKIVTRLLASPRFAEKQAMHWLDGVRYADTAGFHGDNPIPVWPYRDYVLKSFNENMAFDQFTREQIAGDLLPNATRDQKTASAFNRLPRMSAEGGIQDKEYIAKYGADRVRTVSANWLGATTGCAECHDHKFDPILTKDFYSMKAFFADIKETGLVADSGPKAWGTKQNLPNDEQAATYEQLKRDIYDARCALENRANSMWKQQVEWEAQMRKQWESGELAWRFVRPLTATAANGSKLTIYNDEPVDYNFYVRGSLASEHKAGLGLVIASGPLPDNDTYTVTFKPGAGTWRSLAVEVQQDEGLPAVRLARGGDRFLFTEVEADSSEGGRLQFVLANSPGFGERVENNAMAAIDGNPSTGWGVGFGEYRSPMLALRLAQPLTTKEDTLITVRLRNDSAIRRSLAGRFRIAVSPAVFTYPETADSNGKEKARKGDEPTLSVQADQGIPYYTREAIRTVESDRTPSQRALVLQHFIWANPDFTEENARIAKLELARDLLESQIPKVIITEATEPRETRILPRGDWMNTGGAIVAPAIPEFLGKLQTPGRATRLDFANWIVDKNNPLTARVFANRTWHDYFGTGITKTLDDMGSQGEWPVNPELLDWLAAEFMTPSYDAAGAHEWDVKHLIRTIVMSRTYRQSSLATPEAEQKDPDNRLLAHQNRMRVDAEVVRDVNLAVSGLLVDQFGGPSVRPYQPPGYLLAMNFPKRDYSASKGDELYRRGVYVHWQRTFLHPSLLNFDAPTREECVVNRVSSNTPLQALDLMNDPIFVEAARVFAQKILTEGGKKFDKQLDFAFERALSREPSKQESQILKDLYRKNYARYKAEPAEASKLLAIGDAPGSPKLKPAELAAMTTVSRVILNLHETITRN